VVGGSIRYTELGHHVAANDSMSPSDGGGLSAHFLRKLQYGRVARFWVPLLCRERQILIPIRENLMCDRADPTGTMGK